MFSRAICKLRVLSRNLQLCTMLSRFLLCTRVFFLLLHMGSRESCSRLFLLFGLPAPIFCTRHKSRGSQDAFFLGRGGGFLQRAISPGAVWVSGFGGRPPSGSGFWGAPAFLVFWTGLNHFQFNPALRRRRSPAVSCLKLAPWAAPEAPVAFPRTERWRVWRCGSVQSHRALEKSACPLARLLEEGKRQPRMKSKPLVCWDGVPFYWGCITFGDKTPSYQ